MTEIIRINQLVVVHRRAVESVGQQMCMNAQHESITGDRVYKMLKKYAANHNERVVLACTEGYSGDQNTGEQIEYRVCAGLARACQQALRPAKLAARGLTDI